MVAATQHARRSCRGGILFKLLVFLAVVFAAAALAWMLFLPVVVTWQIRERTGFDATVERLSVNPFTGEADIRGFVLTNPPTFPTADFLRVRAFRANATIRSLFSDTMVFDTMAVDLARVTLVKRADGTTNAQAFEQNLSGDEKRLMPTKATRRDFLIRRLDVKVDHVVVADHSLREPATREFAVGIDQHYVDVTDFKQLLAPAVLKNLAPVATAIGGLIPGELGQALTDVTKSGSELLKEAGRKAGERVKGFFDALEESKKP